MLCSGLAGERPRAGDPGVAECSSAVLLPGKPETCVGTEVGETVWWSGTTAATTGHPLQEEEDGRGKEPRVGRLTRLPRGPAGLSPGLALLEGTGSRWLCHLTCLGFNLKKNKAKTLSPRPVGLCCSAKPDGSWGRWLRPRCPLKTS